jgi:outer membrane receptor protein involved in Fe transport
MINTLIKHKASTVLGTAVSAALLSLTGFQAQAQQLEEVVVTAQKRAESLQDVPISVAAMSGDKITDAGIQSFEDIATYVPNFSVSKEGIGDRVIIRGIGSGTNAGFEQSVGTFVDGVYRGRSVQIRNAFLDVGMVEVLRGPQGTLFGKNTVAGALNITTRKPTEEFEAELTTSYNLEFDETELQAYVSGPLTDSLRGRLVLMDRERKDGWIDNEAYDEDGPNTDDQAARLSLEWDVTDSTMLTLRHEYADFAQTGPQFTLQQGSAITDLFGLAPDRERTNVGNVGDPIMDFGSYLDFDGDSQESSLTAESEFDSGILTAILAYSEYDFTRSQDADHTPAPTLRFDDEEAFEQTSLEVRFASETGTDLEYIVGLFYQDQTLLVDQLSYFNAQAAGLVGSRYALLDQDTETWAVFGQGTYSLTDTLRFTLGLRYTEEEKEADQVAHAADLGSKAPNNDYSFTDLTDPSTFGTALLFAAADIVDNHAYDGLQRDEESFTWSANLQWDVTDDAMVYAGASTGFKAGGFNNFYTGDGGFDVVAFLTGGPDAMHNPEDVDFDEEEVITFEVGAKMGLLDGAAELNVSVFRTEYDDLQVAVFNGDTAFKVDNAAEATSQGIEIDGRWAATDKLTVTGSFAWLDFEFDNFTQQACTFDQLQESGLGAAACPAAGVNDMSGRTSAHAPEYSATLSLNHVQPWGDYELSSTLDTIYTDEAYRQDDLDPVALSDSNVRLNGALVFGPQDGQWDISLIAKNLLDEDDSFSFSQDAPFSQGAHVYSPFPPRSVAIRGRLRF